MGQDSSSDRECPIYRVSRETSIHDEHTASFDFLGLSSLSRFSNEFRDNSNYYLDYYASFGSLAVYQLSLSDEDRRRRILVKSGHSRPDFLPAAIDATRDDAFAGNNAQVQAHTTQVMAHTFNDDSSSCVKSGLEVFNILKSGRYIRFRLGSNRSFLLQRVYVFWDSARIYQSDEVIRNICEAASPGTIAARQVLSRYRRKSVEEWLEGVRVPHEQMDRLEKEFAPPGKYRAGISWKKLWDLTKPNAIDDADSPL